MIHKRSRVEIHLDVLKIVNEGTCRPTRIMYEACLSWKSVNRVFKHLTSQGLLASRKEGSHTVYEITGKGRDVLQYFKVPSCQQIEI